MKPLLIEIGSEEIPARFVSKGLAILKENFIRLFDELSVDYGNISEYATPRRLTLYIDNVSEKQRDRTIETLGPPKKIAFDSNGAPTKAALGFARSLNIDISELKVKETERGEYVAAAIEIKGKATVDVLAATLPNLLSSLQLPKSMRWGSSSLRFFRPIHWILAMLGSEIISFELDGIKSGNISYGHRFLSPSAVIIEDPPTYISVLRKKYVLADPDERRKAILQGINAIESTARCKVLKDAELLETVTNLIEYPTVIPGSFDDKFINLPRELLITVMKAHQKYFSVEDGNGNMMPSFIVVSNTKAENNNTVGKGAERVLRARLEDARFYYIEDQKRSLRDYVEELKKVTFQEKLGSLYKKAERIAVLCSLIADTLNLPLKEKLSTASMLCKADLVTGVVGEFPELQGYMGMIYGLNSGENKEVASAIYEHYLPRYPGDILPSSEVGAIVSIADKMDNIASFFYLGLIPSGSEDPFALRRQAAGIINILQSNDYPFSLNNLADKSLQSLEDSAEKREKLSGKILQLFRQRLEGIFLTEGCSHDIVDAVLSTTDLNVTDARQRTHALSAMKKEPEFPALLTAAKRVYNILVRVEPADINENLFTEPAEKDLFGAVGKIKNELTSTDFNALFKLERPINTFFDSVLVMDKNPDIKYNRLALLSAVKKTFDSLGDFSLIVE